MKYLSTILVIIGLGLQGCTSLPDSSTPESSFIPADGTAKTPATPEVNPRMKPGLGRVSVKTPTSLTVMPVRAAASIAGTWVSQGPAPIGGPLAGELTDTDNDGLPDQGEASGAAHTVLAHPSNADIVWIAGVNGGVWRTDNATAARPNWVTQTDNMPSLSIGAMDLDPTDSSANTIVAGFGRHSSFGGEGGLLNGMMRTTDGGNSWTHLTDPVIDSQSCSGIASRGATLVMSSATNIDINQATDNGGLFRSTDTGASWTRIDGASGSGLPTASVFDMVGDPNATNRLYLAAKNLGIYRSDDTGATWTRISNATQNVPFLEESVFNAELAVASNGRLYFATIDSGQPIAIEYSDNPGDAAPSWTAMDLPTTPVPEGASISITDASNETPIVITTGEAHGLEAKHFVQVSGVQGNTAANGVFSVEVQSDTTFALRFTTGNGGYAGGGSMLKVTGLNPKLKPGSQGAIHFSILADRNDPTKVYVGGDSQELPSFVEAQAFTGNLWRGDTTAAPTGESPSPQWAHLTHSNSISAISTGGTAGSTAPHADSREMVQDSNGDILQTDDGGIYRRTNPTSNTGDWVSMNGDLAITEQHNIAYDSVSNIIVSGNQDNGTSFQVSTGSKTWEDVTGGDGGDVAVDESSASPNSIRYVASQQLGGFSRITYDANNQEVAYESPELSGKGAWTPTFVATMELNNTNPARFVLGGENGILETTDKGDTATYLETEQINESALAYGAADNADALYAATESTVLVRISGSGAPTPTLTPFPGSSVTDLLIHPDTANTLYVTDLSAVYMTTDAGQSWTNITGDLTNNLLRNLEFVPDNPAKILVGGVRGVSSMSITDPGVWGSVGTGLPNTLVYDMDYDSADDVLVAGTLGRGAWMLQGVTGGSQGSGTDSGTDTDGDGTPDSSDTDDDNDGVSDASDAFPLDENESVDTDNDGIGNNADTDDDGDGIPDSEDDEPLGASIVATQYLQTTSTSQNITRLDIVNTSETTQQFTGRLYSGDGDLLGTADTLLSSTGIPPRGRLTLTSPDIESLFGATPWSGPAMLEVRGSSTFSLMAKLISPSGLISNTNCVREDRVLNVEGANSSNLTYVRFINTTDSAMSAITGTLYDYDGTPVGSANVELVASLAPKQAIWLSRETIANKVGATWNDDAMLEVNSIAGLKLLNLNLVNGETFFNFSCFETSDSGRVYLQTTSASDNISFTYLVNTSDDTQTFTGTLYNGDGEQLGEADQILDQVPSKARSSIDSGYLESVFGVSAWSGPAILEVKGTGTFELMTKLTSPSGLVSNTNCVRSNQVHNIEPPGSTDKTFVRFINTGSSTLTDIKGSLYDANGNVIGSMDQTLVSSLAPRAAAWLNRDQISDIFGGTWTGAALLELNSAPADLRLLNLNFINSETFFNFSCYEEAR